jgi:hypothetical protein
MIGVTCSVTVLVAPAGRSPRSHMTVGPGGAQLTPSGASIESTENAGGTRSVTVTPDAGLGPWFTTVKSNVVGTPAVAADGPVFCASRSASAKT